jgi:hypothetical protein
LDGLPALSKKPLGTAVTADSPNTTFVSLTDLRALRIRHVGDLNPHASMQS